MNLCAWKLLLLCAVYQAYADPECCEKKVWRKLNGVLPVCFKAEANGHVEFQAEYGINMYKLRYVHRDGFHECQYGHGGYFGCEAYLPHDGHMSHHAYHSAPVYGAYGGGFQYDEPQRDQPQHDSPQKDDAKAQQHPGIGPMNDMSQSAGPFYLQKCSVFLTDEQNNVIYPQPPYEKPYFAEPSINRPAWDHSITFNINMAPISISRSQKLRLYHGEDLFDMGSDNNSGNLCVDVYAYGDLVGELPL